MTIQQMLLAVGAAGDPPYGMYYKSANGASYTFTVPSGVTQVSAVVVGGGGGGGGSDGVSGPGGSAGGGGGLAYGTFSVTPGETFTVYTGHGGSGHSGTGTGYAGSGGESYLQRNSNSVNNTNKIRHNGNPGNGLRKCGSRDGFNSDGSDDLNGGVRRSGSESSLGGSFSDDDYTCSRRACYICKTKFGIRKVYNARTKHVCKVCGKCFCKDCGTTNHLEFQSCKVPSTCTCCRCQGKLDQTPKVALLNIGSEELKGNEIIKETTKTHCS